MFTCRIFNGPHMIVEHSQPSFSPVLQFAVNTMMSVIGQGSKDYRVEIVDKEKFVCFHALSENEQARVKAAGTVVTNAVSVQE